jgi:hypothetical protein
VLAHGLNTQGGEVVNPVVAEALAALGSPLA